MKPTQLFAVTLTVSLGAVSLASCGFKDYKNPDAGTSTVQGQGGAQTSSPPATPAPTASSGTGSGTGTGTTTGGTTTATATFTQVNSQILQTQCVACHGSGASPDLTSYASFANDTRYVIPGNAAGSVLYQVVLDGSMPRGGNSLSASELQLIYNWIQEGAKND